MEVISIEDSPVRTRQRPSKAAAETYIISLSDSDDPAESPHLPLQRALSERDLSRPVQLAALQTKTIRTQPHLRIGMEEMEFSPHLTINALQSRTTREPGLVADNVGIKSSSDEELPDIITNPKARTVASTRPTMSKSETLPTSFSVSSTAANSIAPLSSRILENIDSLMQQRTSSTTPTNKRAVLKKSCSKARSTESVTEEDSDSLTGIKVSRGKTKNGTEGNSVALKAQKQAEREKIRLEKAQEKERRLIEKRKAQSIAAVNTLKKTKKDSAPEMIVEMCNRVEGSAFVTHFEQFMQSLGCSWSMLPMPVNGLIRIRRKIVAEYDNEKGYWIPLPSPKIADEDQLILFIKGSEFLRIATSAELLAEHVRSVRRQRPSARVLYLIEGLAALVRKSQAQKNRAYQAAVRAAGIPSDEVSRPWKVRVTNATSDLDETMIENALLDLQVLHNCLIVHSTSPADSAEHLSILISDLSTVPYKLERTGKSDTFCTESGQIKTGVDARDTFEKMLQAIARVTPQIAQAVATKYSSIRELCNALQGGPQILELIPKGHNVDGTVTGQVLGTATSVKIHRALMSQDAHLDA